MKRVEVPVKRVRERSRNLSELEEISHMHMDEGAANDS